MKSSRLTQAEVIANLRAKYELRREIEAAFADLPDDYCLDSTQAALFLGRTAQNLAQMRCQGRGPKFVPGHRTKYLMGDLRRCRNEEIARQPALTPKQRQASALARVNTSTNGPRREKAAPAS